MVHATFGCKLLQAVQEQTTDEPIQKIVFSEPTKKIQCYVATFG
jgi:hypothetical protein